MKQILSFAAMLALVLPLFITNAQEHPKSSSDKKECVTKTAKSGCCPSSKVKTTKASNSHDGCSTDGKAKLMKASHKADGCSDKAKAACADKCDHKHASADSKDGQN
jgi:hypothetical protein